MRRTAALRLALAAVAGLGLNLASFEAFARLTGDRRDSIRTLFRIGNAGAGPRKEEIAARASQARR